MPKTWIVGEKTTKKKVRKKWKKKLKKKREKKKKKKATVPVKAYENYISSEKNKKKWRMQFLLIFLWSVFFGGLQVTRTENVGEKTGKKKN